MVGLKDVLAILDHWDEWKKLREAPARVDALEKRLAALEARLQRAPGEACPKCGALDFRIEKSQAPSGMGRGPLAMMGVREHHWKCNACGYADTKMETPK